MPQWRDSSLHNAILPQVVFELLRGELWVVIACNSHWQFMCCKHLHKALYDSVSSHRLHYINLIDTTVVVHTDKDVISRRQRSQNIHRLVLPWPFRQLR